MPALGMAQETGLIVSWLKQPGDAVRTGEALMEVETDKAVMEVEALADGFLSDVRAAPGESVPVGQVVAMIADSADVVPATQIRPVGTEPAAAAAPVALPEGQNIIMPALGMAQETGRVVSWAKVPGEAVAADDVLLEVETDKSTMEVPAGHDGFVAALLAEAGQDVPVGDVIAIITASKPDAPIQARAAAHSAVSEPTPVAPTAPAPHRALEAVVAPDGRILASPKARRLAAEEGLDLGRLVAAGHKQPFHVTDLETLRNLSVTQVDASILPVSAAPATMMHAAHQIGARAPLAGTIDFLARMEAEAGITLPPDTLWARFAAEAYRAAAGVAEIMVEVAALGADPRRIANPDRARLSDQSEDTSGRPAALILRDLTASPITTMRVGPSTAPILSIGKDGESYLLTLDFTDGQLSEDAAIAFITGFAGRLSEPLLHMI